MIIVKLCGGMGNQLFQYAFGRYLSIKYNTALKIDLSFLKRRDMGPNFMYRNYDLDLFNVQEDFNITQSDINNSLKANEPWGAFEYQEILIKEIGKVISSKNVIIEGYWQTEKYFKDVEEQIRKDFTFRNLIENSDDRTKLMLEDIKKSNSIMVNIRRTDYLNTNFHGVMGTEYIDKASKIIESKIENPKYFVFSDDIKWCEDNIKLNNMVIVDHSYKGDRFGYYLQLMKNCKHFIIPNSSFAWWSAWLNEDKDKIVIAPEKWIAEENMKVKDLIPENWIKIQK